MAETCGRLAPHVSEGLRSSLLLPMLQQQAEDDPSSAVREGVVRNLVSLLEVRRALCVPAARVSPPPFPLTVCS